MKKVLSIMLSVMMVFTMMPVNVFAAETKATTDTTAVSVSNVGDDLVTVTIKNLGATDDSPEPYYLIKKASEAAPDASTIKTTGKRLYYYSWDPSTEKSDTCLDVIPGTEYVVYAVIYHGENPSNIAKAEFKTTGTYTEPFKGDIVQLTYTDAEKPQAEPATFKKFVDLQTALDAVPATATNIKITLLADQKINLGAMEALLSPNCDCTFDMAGHKLEIRHGTMNSIYMFDVWYDITLTIEDTSKDKTGVILVNALDGYGVNLNAGTAIFKGGTLISKGLMNNSSNNAVYNEKGTSFIMQDGKIEGMMYINGDLIVKNGSITSDSMIGTVTLEAKASLAMENGIIHNNCPTYSGTASAVVQESAYQLEKENIKVTGGKLSSVNGPALCLTDTTKTADKSNQERHVLISGANIESENYAAIDYKHNNVAKAKETAKYVLDITGNTVLKGKTTAINLLGRYTGAAIGDKDAKTLPKREINISDTAKIQYGEDGTFALPNSSCLTLPEGKVLDVKADSNGVYGFATKESLKQTVENLQYGYQNMDLLNTTIASAKEIYDAGAQKYDNTLWQNFEKAYKAALPIPANVNANQNEIDYFLNNIAKTQSAMIEQAQKGVDVSKLANGTYNVDIEMRNSSDALKRPSMADGAVNHKALLTMNDGKGTLTVDFKPIQVMNIYGALMNYWFYNVPTPEEVKAAIVNGTSREEAKYESFGTVNVNTGEVTPITGTPAEKPAATNRIRPTKISYELPYMGANNGLNEIYGRVSVDAMSGEGGPGDQNVIMYIKYHTLTPIKVEDTLMVDTNSVLLAENGTQKVNAEVWGTEGYTIAWTIDKNDVATVKDGLITAKNPGKATITVTATKEKNTITKKIQVEVKAGSAVKVENVVAKGDKVTAEITGDVLVSQNNGSVDNNASKVVVDAKTADKNIKTTEIVIKNATADALEGVNKDIEIETNVGTIKLDKTLISKVAAKNADVTLKLTESAIPEMKENISACYNLELVSGNKAVAFDGGKATITVPAVEGAKYAYHIVDGKIKDKKVIAISGTEMTWTTDHFSTWGISAKDYAIDTTEPVKPGYFLADGKYYVDVALWHATEDRASMGNVAFQSNNKALVTVKDGKITNVEIATSAVDVSGIHSGITSMMVEGKAVKVLEKAELITLPANNKYEYIKRASFELPATAQPELASETTYAKVEFTVPDTPMDMVPEIKENGLSARLKFVWSTATATKDENVKPEENKPVKPEVKPTEHAILNGANQVVNVAGKDVSIRLQGEPSELVAVFMDGKLVKRTNYEITKGSVVVTFDKEYIASLGAGKHTVGFKFNNGEIVETSLTLSADAAKPGAPKTGDTANMLPWMVLALAAGSAVVAVRRKED